MSARTPQWIVALGIGLVLSPLLSLTPLLQYIGWFLASLFHECGHCVIALFTGHSAIPAIRLDGHAAAIHGPQSKLLVWATWALLGYGVFWFRERLAIACGFAGLTLVYPALVFTGFGEVAHLAAGHLGELAFASYAMWCASTGGFTQGMAERVAYALLGFWLFGRNAVLFFGLFADASARAHYEGNGSFGMQNDLIRIADQCSMSLQTIGMFFLAITIVTAIVSIGVSATHAHGTARP
ncbi:MAG: hypothetical protein H6832_14085 [Planctomycetes bacterium]|nr:hypothetical protein [Planctomycetota bacterium]MCB9919527.1 hypothetical protein [Planctomycetota bacterium]